MLGSLLCLPGSSSVLLDPYGSTISETTSEAWSVEVLPSDSGRPSDSSFSFCYCLYLRCVFAWIFMVDTVGVGTPGVVGWHSIPKMCACICHHICAHLPVFQGRSACARERQIRVSLEGPPGVFAPVVEHCWGKQLFAVTVFILLGLTLHCSEAFIVRTVCTQSISVPIQFVFFFQIEHTVQTFY